MSPAWLPGSQAAAAPSQPAAPEADEANKGEQPICVVGLNQAGREGWTVMAELLVALRDERITWGTSTMADFYMGLAPAARLDFQREIRVAIESRMSAKEAEDMALIIEHAIALERGHYPQPVALSLVDQYISMLLLLASYLEAVDMVIRGHARFKPVHGYVDFCKTSTPIATLTAEGEAVRQKISGALGHHFGGGQVIVP